MTLFFRQFRAELAKLFARKRTWMGFGAFLGLELVIWILLRSQKVEDRFRAVFSRSDAFTGVFEDYFRGLTIALLIVRFTVFLLGGLFLALVAGDIVSKEAEDGTLRMTLCRPVSRLRVLGVKFLTCITYTFTLIFFIAGTALLVGGSWRGLGGLFVFVPEEQVFAIFPHPEGLPRFVGALSILAASVCVVSSLAFMFSCVNAKPAAATVLTLTIFLADRILYMWPQFADYRNWFMSAHVDTWMNAFRDPIPWAKIAEDFVYLAGLNATFVIIGVTIFCRRDFKS